MPTTSTRIFLSAEWRALTMLNYAIDPASLQRFVPAGCELDYFHGRTFVSMVGFRFLRTNLLGVPVPFHRDFDEVNLRFHVRHRTPDGEWRRGVVFIKEIVPKGMIAFVAKTVYNENYASMPMRSLVELPGRVKYGWRHHGRWNRISTTISGESFISADDAEETFIMEHYWGYTRQRDGGTMEYEVAHPRWRVWRCDSAELVCDVATMYGSEFASVLSGVPSSAFVADGSAVNVHRGQRLKV